MGFNERVHAYIAAKYYTYLVETFGERGRLAFVHGTQYYASQRGRSTAAIWTPPSPGGSTPIWAMWWTRPFMKPTAAFTG